MIQPTAQQFLFQRIREMLPASQPLVDTVADILHLSADSAYRRIRGETPLVLDEANELCRHFRISLDRLFEIKPDSILFRNIRVDTAQYDYMKFLHDLCSQLNYINSFPDKEIVYLTKDVPIFHNFYEQPLIAFRYYFWMKFILQDPGFANRGFEFSLLSPEIERKSRELAAAYTTIPSVEIWNSECINSIISQVEFCRDGGFFSSLGDIKAVYESIEHMLEHLRNQVEAGSKFMPGENPENRKQNFRFYFNRVILGDNTILVNTGNERTAYLNYDVLNYMVTRDPEFCETCYQDLQNMMRKATIISQTSERQRNRFFGILMNKIEDRKKTL